MRKILIVLLAGWVVLVVGCHLPGIRGNGQIKTEERPIAAFANLDAGGAFEIEWQNGSPAVRITTDENLLPYIENNVSDEYTASAHTGARLAYPRNQSRHLKSNAGRWKDQGRRQVNRKAVERANLCSGIEGRVAEVSLDGSIDRLLVDMTGASHLAADGLQAKTAEISTTGAGDAEVAVTDTLKVVITGAGKVTYSGNPPTIKKQITGAGSIRHKD